MISRDFRPLSPVRLLPWLNLADRALRSGQSQSQSQGSKFVRAAVREKMQQEAAR